MSSWKLAHHNALGARESINLEPGQSSILQRMLFSRKMSVVECTTYKMTCSMDPYNSAGILEYSEGWDSLVLYAH